MVNNGYIRLEAKMLDDILIGNNVKIDANGVVIKKCTR